ncbi:MAG TPA: PHP-associated domain-containing protein [Anaerolineaceae bacterium]|nr:PHP domain-containing protein [Anaerolineaceae bacterium]HQP08106.1 PHP-associated domain-containing protein [Anaerolineaceae bacterium]
MITLEFHCHTMYSKDSLMHPAQLIRIARARGIDRIVVTDHNTIRGALAARQLAPEMIIIGEEIQTTEGELLAAFVNREVPAGLEPVAAIKMLKDQNAFISVSHPFDAMRSGWKPETLAALLDSLDAIEVFNSRTMRPLHNEAAKLFAQDHALLAIAGSDSHAAIEVGKAVMQLPDFTTSDELRAAVRQASIQGRLSPHWVHFISTYAKNYKKVFPNWEQKINRRNLP